MKIILSRKGFDGSNGGCASPILPDGTMLSMPIPNETDNVKYSELLYDGRSYADILSQLNPKGNYSNCHLDPDIRADLHSNAIDGWSPAYGQIGAAQGLLHNAGVCEGDLFLFFGWFHKTKLTDNGYKFIGNKESPNFYEIAELHAVYGYMQVGKIITDADEIAQYSWHPHASSDRLKDKRNALYLPTEKLSFNNDLAGCGILNYREDRVLTMENKSRGTWISHGFLMPDKVYGNKKNSSKSDGLYYAGIWQELVVNESPELLQWVKSIIE